MCLLGFTRISRGLLLLWPSIALYWMNPNYANIVKHDVDNLLKAGFIKLVEEGTWLSPLSLFLRKMGSCAYVLTTGSSV
jgi:hypothetical protein